MGQTTATPGHGGPRPPQDHWDRRIFRRTGTLEFRAWVAWLDEEGGDECSAVRLLDISRGGAAIELDEDPPRGRSVWLWLNDLATPRVVEAEVVGVEHGRQLRRRAHLAFLDLCPRELYEAAVNGLRLETGRDPTG